MPYANIKITRGGAAAHRTAVPTNTALYSWTIRNMLTQLGVP